MTLREMGGARERGGGGNEYKRVLSEFPLGPFQRGSWSVGHKKVPIYFSRFWRDHRYKSDLQEYRLIFGGKKTALFFISQSCRI